MRSTRLASDAHVRNRLFPKTRSWFALEAPLELLSPLSVLRILYGLGAVVWPAAAILLLGPSVAAVAIAVVIATVFAVWVILLFVHRVDIRWTSNLLVLSTAQIIVLIWAGHGTTVSYVYLLFLIPVGVTGALFLTLRALVSQEAVTVLGLWLALTAPLGVTESLLVSTIAGLALLSSTLTVWFLVRTAKRQGSFDSDTGLPNGVGLSQRVANRQPSFVVAVTRLEGIADARQALGHEVGAELLKRAVEDLGQVLPPATFIGRVDGDELVVTSGLSPTEPPATPRAERELEALALAHTLAGAVNAGRYLVGDIEISLRTHVGLAIAPWDGTEVPELVRRASLSASRAAAEGQAQLLWDGDFGAMTADDLTLLADLRLAAEKGELSLAYQPQVTTVSARVASVEALLRWTSPTHGAVSPGRFVPLAERTGLIDRLTDWVLDEALDAQVRWRSAGLDIPVSVNLSPTTLTTPELPIQILENLARRGLPPRSLTVEVTETAAIDLLQAVRLLRPLHDEGVRISIDDFGTGYTSLATLPDLPLDELKVDQRFVLRSSTSPADDAIVRTVRELALRLGLDAVAEGVETGEVFDRMCDYGFDLLQGYYLSKPLKESDLITYANERVQDEHTFTRERRKIRRPLILESPGAAQASEP